MGRTSYTEPVTSNPPKKSGSKEFLPTAAEFTKAKSGSSHNICGSSDEGDVPVSSSVQRKARPSAIYSSSEDESDPVLPKLGSRRRASKLPVPNSPNPQLPHTPTSSRVRPLGFILGGNTGNAPLSRSQRYKTEPRSIGRKIDDQDSKVSRRTRSHITENLEFDSPKRKVRPSTSSYNDLNRNTTESDTDEEDDEITQTPSKKSNSNAGLAPTRNLNTGDSDESSEDLVISPKRRRLVAKNFEDPPQNELDDSHNQIAEDLQADMDDLRDTGKLFTISFQIPFIYFSLFVIVLNQLLYIAKQLLQPLFLQEFSRDLANMENVEIHKRRTRGRAVNSKKSAKQEQLEILKRRRAGANTIELSSDSDAVPLSSSFRGTKHSYDQVSEEDEISDMEAVRQSLRAGEDDEDSFVENDDIDTLGAPDWRNEIPLEFTVHNMQKPIKNFKVAVEWMIHNKLNPAFARNDTIYKMAVTKLDDEVQGYSGSKFLSPVWNKEFLRILKEFPELSIIDVPTMLEHKCDACNRSGHPAKHQLTFSGEAYDRRTLESLSSDEDSEDQSEERSNNKESPTFYLGRLVIAIKGIQEVC